MKRFSGVAFCFSLLVTISFTLPVSAFADSLTDFKVEQLLQKLEAATLPTEVDGIATATASREGRVDFTITVNRVLPNNEPMGCRVSVSHYSTTDYTISYSEFANGKVVWSGNIGICKVSIAYLWQNADPLGKMVLSASIGPSLTCSCNENSMNRVSGHPGKTLPQPANKAITKYADTFRI